MKRQTVRSEVWQNETIRTRAQIVRDSDGAALGPSDALVWSLDVFDPDSADAQTAIYSLHNQAPSDILAYTYSTVGWDGDSPGWNMSHSCASDAYTRVGGHLNRYEYRIATVSDGGIAIVHQVRLLPLWSEDG
jgi:hypothetical protein